MNIEMYSICNMGLPSKPLQDAVDSALLSDGMVVAVADGMSHFPDHGEAARWAAENAVWLAVQNQPRLGKAPVANAENGQWLGDILYKLHQNLSNSGVAIVLVALTQDGCCHFAALGDVALWCRLRQTSRWLRLNTSTPHEGQELKYYLGAPQLTRDKVVTGVVDGVDCVVAMTDGYYKRPEAYPGGGAPLTDRVAWHPEEPPVVAGRLGAGLAQALQEGRPKSPHDNYTAVAIRLPPAAAPAADEEPSSRAELGTSRSTLVAMWTAMVLAIVAVGALLWGASLQRHRDSAAPATAATPSGELVPAPAGETK